MGGIQFRCQNFGTEFFINGTELFINGTESFINGTESFMNGTESFTNGTESFMNFGAKKIVKNSVPNQNPNKSAPIILYNKYWTTASTKSGRSRKLKPESHELNWRIPRRRTKRQNMD